MLRLISILAACLMAASCLSVLPEPKSAKALYRLGPIAASQTVSATILVREPEAPRTFAGRAIAAESPDGALRYVPGVEWADNITRMMQLALLDSLQGIDGAVVLAYDTAAPGDYELDWRLSDFVLFGDEARCKVEVTLLDGRTRAPVAQELISARVAVSGTDNPSRTRALAEAARQCVADTAAFVAGATNKKASPTG